MSPPLQNALPAPVTMTAPLSAAHGAFEELIVQAVGPGEAPIAEWDLRPNNAGAAEVGAMAAQHLNAAGIGEHEVLKHAGSIGLRAGGIA